MSSPGFLKTFRVLDLSQFIPGPFATQVLADMGADVLKVEPLSGDPIMNLDAILKSKISSSIYNKVNSGKRILRIDLKTYNGRECLKNLICTADILLESYRPGVMTRLGFDYPSVKKLNDQIIYCSLSGFGQTGPCAKRTGHDINYLAMTGALSVNGPSHTPLPPFPPITDYGGAMHAANSILGALVRRLTIGNGAYLDIAMADVILTWQAYALSTLENGKDKKRELSRESHLLNGGAACYNVYKTQDSKFISLGAVEKKFWTNFCKSVKRLDWVERQGDPFPQLSLISEVAKMIASQNLHEWDTLLGQVECCYHPVLRYNELHKWPQIKNRKVISYDNGQFAMNSATWIDNMPPCARSPIQIVSLQEAVMRWK